MKNCRHIRYVRLSLMGKIISLLLVFHFPISLVFSGPGYANFNETQLPDIGTIISPTDQYQPLVFQGIGLHPSNPLKISFILNDNQTNLQQSEVQADANRLIDYFLVALTLPKTEMWVNLSPFEENRVITDSLGKTQMGRDMLVQDYMLKQLTSSLLHPETKNGEKFWKRVHALAYEKYGTSEIAMDTYNKVWIVPDTAEIVEYEDGVLIEDCHLKVLLERDYIAMTKGLLQDKHADVSEDDNFQAEILKEVVIPEIEREINQGRTFAPLRQMFHSLILATWYKQSLEESLLVQKFADQNRISNLDIPEQGITQKIYKQYVASYHRGVYNFVKEDYDSETDKTITRQYFSGGISTDQLEVNVAERVRSMLDPEQDLAMISVYLDDGSPFSQAMLSREDKLKESLALRQESIDDLRAAFGRFFPNFDFGSMGIFQGVMETMFIPWSEGYRAAERQMRDELFRPYFANVEAMGEVADNLAAMYPAFALQSIFLKPLSDQARKMRKTIDYVKSLEDLKPEPFSDSETILRVPGLFYLARIKDRDGQTVDPNLPPSMIITPHSGHDGHSLADYTNKDRTDVNSLAQTFKKRGYDTYLLVWESSEGLQDIGDLQEAVHLSVRTIGRKVVLSGLSHGGAVAAHYMGVMPNNVAGLIVAGAPVNSKIGDNDVIKAAEKGMDMYSWMQFGHGEKDVYPGLAQLFAFKHLGFDGGYDKRVTSWQRLIENIDNIDYVERDRIFRIWFEYVNNIGYFVDWIDQVFKRNHFVVGQLTFRMGHKKYKSSPENYRPDVPIATIEGSTDDITPPPTITAAEMSEVTAESQALWKFLTHGIVSRTGLGGQQVGELEAFDYLVESGYVDNTETGDVNYAYIQQDKVVQAMELQALKTKAFQFAVTDFQERDDTAETVLPRIQDLISAITQQSGRGEFVAEHYSQALGWLNADVSSYRLMDRDELVGLEPDLVTAIETQQQTNVSELTDAQLAKVAKSFEGIKLKRSILNELFPDQTPSAVRVEDADFELDISVELLDQLVRTWRKRLFSDSDPKSVNSRPNEKAVMRQPFADMAFQNNFDAFLSIDVPFIRDTEETELRRIFDQLGALRGQSSDIFSIVPTEKKYQQLKLVRGGHIGIYNGSLSQRAWRDILTEFEGHWQDDGKTHTLPKGEGLVLAIEDRVIRKDQAMKSMAAIDETENSRNLGGIDFNANLLDMNIRQIESGVVVPSFPVDDPGIDFDNLSPVILNITTK